LSSGLVALHSRPNQYALLATVRGALTLPILRLIASSGVFQAQSSLAAWGSTSEAISLAQRVRLLCNQQEPPPSVKQADKKPCDKQSPLYGRRWNKRMNTILSKLDDLARLSGGGSAIVVFFGTTPTEQSSTEFAGSQLIAGPSEAADVLEPVGDDGDDEDLKTVRQLKSAADSKRAPRGYQGLSGALSLFAVGSSSAMQDWVLQPDVRDSLYEFAFRHVMDSEAPGQFCRWLPAILPLGFSLTLFSCRSWLSVGSAVAGSPRPPGPYGDDASTPSNGVAGAHDAVGEAQQDGVLRFVLHGWVVGVSPCGFDLVYCQPA
jgi:hypothetical protein